MRVPPSIPVVLICVSFLGAACDETSTASKVAATEDAGVAPIAKDKLTGLMPRDVGPWKLQSVIGDVHALRKAEITSATAVYTRGSGETVAKVSLALVDGAHRAEAYASFETAWATKLENASLGYSRLELDGDRAVQILSRHPPTVQIHVLLAERIVLQADGEKLRPDELLAFVKGLPLETLRGLK